MQLSDETAWMQAAAALRAECRRAKEALSSHPYAELMIPLPTGMVRQQVTREQFEALIEPYVAQSVDRLVQAVADAGLQQSDLAAVCLSGGASYMPMVARAIGAAFGGVAVERRGDPKTAVAVGAALPSGPIGSAGAGGGQHPGRSRDADQPHRRTRAAAAGRSPGLVPAGFAPAGLVPAGFAPTGFVPLARLVAAAGAANAPGSLRRRLLVPALVAVVAVVAVVGALLLRGGGEPLEVAQAGGEATTTTEAEARDRPARRVTTTTDGGSTTSTTAAAATLESPVEVFLGTEIRRRWQTDPAAGTVTVAVTLTSTAAVPFRWHHDEPLSASLVAPADAAAVRSDPAAELPDSGVLRWWFELAPAQAATFTYVVARQAGWPASLDLAALQTWERDRAAAAVGRQNAVLTANQLVDRTAAPGTAGAPVVTAAPTGGATAPPIVVQTPVVQQPAGPAAPTVSIRGNGQLCAEQQSVIEGVASNAVSGVWTISSFTIADASWSPQSTTQTLTPSRGAIGGTYRATLQVVNGANVAATAVFDFTVVDCTPPPTVEIQGPASVCVGGTGYFTGVAANAVLGQWDLPEFAIEDASWTPDSPSMYVQPSSAAFGGTYTFTLTVVGPSGALATAQRAFSVNC
ncbi:MAG: Hsp70 family protein [Acidimicrobiales bacterium]